MNSIGMIVIHYRAAHQVDELLESTSRWTQKPNHIVVIDNSGDLPESLASEEVAVIRPGNNLGYAGAVNLGLQHFRARTMRYALVCTQDARLSDDSLERLLTGMASSPNTGIVAPLLEYSSHRGIVFSAGGEMTSRAVSYHKHQGDPRSAVSSTGLKDTCWADGAVLLVDIEKSLEIGDLDEAYFLYVEEIDYQFSMRRAGYHVKIALGATAFQEPGRYPDYLRYRNHVYFTQKFRIDFKPWPWLRIMVRDVAKWVAGRKKFDVIAAITGVRDAKKGRMGVLE